MAVDHRAELKRIRTFPSLVAYLRDELGWPIESDDFEELTFPYEPEELGIDSASAAKIQDIKQLRRLSVDQPWGIFFVKFEPKRLPVVALRRILTSVALKKRASANNAERAAWQLDDLLFVSNYGEGEQRQISFAHFSKPGNTTNLPTLRVLGWDNRDTALHLDHVAEMLSERLAWPEDETDVESWREEWRSAFTLRHREVITTSRDLSVRLAGLARAIRDRIEATLAIETEAGSLTGLMKAFQQALIHDLDAQAFADMYAQTVTYGLLSARVEDPTRGGSTGLADQMAATSPFLKALMKTFLEPVGNEVTSAHTPDINFDELGVGEVVTMLDDANMQAVLHDFGDRRPEDDPVIHFYEEFLSEYDRNQKVQRGVFYTPRPVVAFIVRAVHERLKTEFGLADGLADISSWSEVAERCEGMRIPDGLSRDTPFVQILDPAVGTGTFLVEVIGLIYETLTAKWKAAGYGSTERRELWNDYVPKHLLQRLHGFELLMAPYAIAHMKIGLKLYETGYEFGPDERIRIYLTNALEPAHEVDGQLVLAIPPLAKEAEAASTVKEQHRFTVVVGNPPYQRASANRGAYVEDLIAPYKEPVRAERNIQPLSDDYIKFLRLSEVMLETAGAGVHGMITNNTYLSGRIHRGIRQSLLSSYSQLYITNLHGSGKVSLAAVSGRGDENVFDIMQGVAISVFVRSASEQEVMYSELVGPRTTKYTALASSEVPGWQVLAPVPPLHLLIPRSERGSAEFMAFESLEDLFAFRSVSGKPGDDHLLVSLDRAEIVPKLEALRRTAGQDPGVKLTEAGRKVAAVPQSELFRESMVEQYAYRPFDTRYVYNDPAVWTRPVNELRDYIDGKPILLVTKIVKDRSFAHVFVTRQLADVIFLSNSSSVNAYSFPMSGPSVRDEGLGGTNEPSGNMNLKAMVSKGAYVPDCAEALGFIYAVLHSPTYRERYFEQLQYDFPRIPRMSNGPLTGELTRLGKELLALHLMESDVLNGFRTEVIGRGDLEVETVTYSEGTAWIDKARSKGFRGIEPEVWSFKVGAYQVCEKWLKDRRRRGGKHPRPGRRLTEDDVDHYQRIVVAVAETIRLMAEIDEAIDGNGGWPEAFQADGVAAENTAV